MASPHAPLSRNRQQRIARQQRMTLISDRRRLIHPFRYDPRTAFDGSRRPTNKTLGTSKLWRHAFTINGPNDPYPSKRRAPIGDMFRGMFDYTFDLPDEDRWTPVKPLGNGSYGAAALLQHVDEAGKVDDYVVAKYSVAREKERWHPRFPELSVEAVNMIRLNEFNNEGLLFLRNFKHFEDDKLWLYLLEYCPNFDTEVLRITYRAMKRHIPEAFIWYLFYGLAKGLVAMEQGPFNEPADPTGAFMAHRDMKPTNTFLGYPSANPGNVEKSDPSYIASKHQYPHVKIADFGMSTLAGKNTDNRMERHTAGSRPWYAPEVRWEQTKPDSWFIPFTRTLFGDDGKPVPPRRLMPGHKRMHRITPAANVFGAGFMMYQFITLDDAGPMSNYLDRIMREIEPMPAGTVLGTEDYEQRRTRINKIDERERSFGLTDVEKREYGHQLDTAVMLEHWKDSKYSWPLRKLVERCVAFLPEDRITAKDLLKELERLMPYCARNLECLNAADYEKATKVCTTEADLNDLEPGNVDIMLDETFWRQLLLSYKWLDTDVGNIRPVLDSKDGPIPPEIYAELQALFSQGRKEAKNKATVNQSARSQPRMRRPVAGSESHARNTQGGKGSSCRQQ